MNDYLEIGERPDVWDDYHRRELDEYDLHLRAKEERRFDECDPDPKPPRRITRQEANRAGLLPGQWRAAVLERDQGCRIHGNPADCAHGWAAHHIVSQQELRRVAPECLWNPLSGMGVCGLAHRQHHNRTRPIYLVEVPPVCVAYLRSHGLGAWLDRHYDLVEIPL